MLWTANHVNTHGNYDYDVQRKSRLRESIA